MSYDKAQATREFSRWSAGYDRSILQWLLFGPAHRAIITRLKRDPATGRRRSSTWVAVPVSSPPASRRPCLGPRFGESTSSTAC